MARRVTIKVVVEDVDDNNVIGIMQMIKEALKDVERFSVELSSIR